MSQTVVLWGLNYDYAPRHLKLALGSREAMQARRAERQSERGWVRLDIEPLHQAPLPISAYDRFQAEVAQRVKHGLRLTDAVAVYDQADAVHQAYRRHGSYGAWEQIMLDAMGELGRHATALYAVEKAAFLAAYEREQVGVDL